MARLGRLGPHGERGCKANMEIAADAGPVPGSIGQALGYVRSSMRYLAAADYAGQPVEVQAQVLKAMHEVGAGQAAVFGTAGRAFTAAHGYDGYAQKNLGRWHVSIGRVTRTAGYAAKAWVRRCERHPGVMAALAELDVISESWARALIGWSDALPEEFWAQADEILIAAVRAGASLEDLARIAAELAARLLGPDQDKGKEPGRGVRLETTFDGAGVLAGDLTPGCAAVVGAVLGSLAQPAGKDDTRSHGERMHDALEEAMRRLLAARLLPQRAGAPVTALVHISFADLAGLDGGSVLAQAWIASVHARWAAERAGAFAQPGDGGAWLSGDDAAKAVQDAMIVPVVTADVDITVIGGLIECAVQHRGHADAAGDEAAPEADRGMHAREMARLEREIIGKAVALLSGPGGLAGFLRRQLAGKGLDGPSLPLDVGETGRIPPQIRRAVTVRDRHCAFPGGCDQPAAACEPHHTVPRAGHGRTALRLLGLFCWHHHHIVVHTWGWTLKIQPDGTITATKPDGTTYDPRPPPPRPG